MFTSRRALIATTALVAVVGLSCWANRKQAEKQKQLIASISQTVALGASRDWVNRECNRVVQEHRAFKYWSEVEDWKGNVARLDSPVTDGAGNWVIYVLFDGDAVDAVLIRTLDNKTDHPTNAPPDRVANPQNPLLPGFGGVQQH